MGKVLLAALDPTTLDGRARGAEPLRHHAALAARPPGELDAALREVRAKGWALADQDLAPGIRSIAAGVRDGDGKVVAAHQRHSARGGDVCR